MIAEMLTRVPGPESMKVDPSRIIFTEKLEGTNVWDLDGNRFLDMTSGGGLLPFGSVDEGLVELRELDWEFDGYHGYHLVADYLANLRVLQIGAGIACAFAPIVEKEGVDLFELVDTDPGEFDIVVVKAEFLDDVSLSRVASWCQQHGLRWLVDERDFGLFRCGKPFASASHNPDVILTSLAGQGMQSTDLLFSRIKQDLPSADLVMIAKNYADSDLMRTINLQSLELSGLFHDCMEGKTIGCVGAFHFIELASVEEVERVCVGLLQRGIIVATMGVKVVFLPSLYLALGEIIFAVNHIRLVIDDINEASLPWMNDNLRN